MSPPVSLKELLYRRDLVRSLEQPLLQQLREGQPLTPKEEAFLINCILMEELYEKQIYELLKC